MNNIIKGGTIILNRDDKYFSYLKKGRTSKSQNNYLWEKQKI